MKRTHSHQKYPLLFLAMFFICVSASISLAMMPSGLDHPNNSEVTIPTYNPFSIASVEADSVYVYDVVTKKVIYEKNSDKVKPLASITKAMTVYTALDFYSATSTISISKRALASEGDTGLLLNENWKFKDLRNFTMLTSSNDGAVALAISHSPLDDSSTTEDRFIARMNEKASLLGLTTLKFNNETGLDLSPVESGAYGSAKDVGLMFGSILQTNPEVLEVTKYDDHSFRSLNGIEHYGRNTDTAVNKIPGILASKTGYTDLAGGNLVIAFDVEIGHPIVIVVLGSSYSGRFDDVVALASSTRAFYFQH